MGSVASCHCRGLTSRASRCRSRPRASSRCRRRSWWSRKANASSSKPAVRSTGTGSSPKARRHPCADCSRELPAWSPRSPSGAAISIISSHSTRSPWSSPRRDSGVPGHSGARCVTTASSGNSTPGVSPVPRGCAWSASPRPVTARARPTSTSPASSRISATATIDPPSRSSARTTRCRSRAASSAPRRASRRACAAPATVPSSSAR